MSNRIVIIGAGGHAKVVCDAILSQKKYIVMGFVDITLPIGTIVSSDYQVIANEDNLADLKVHADFFIVAVGNNAVRKRIFDSVKKVLKPATIIHADAVIGSDVLIGEGAVILANVVINASSKIGENVIVNSLSVIDHDCIIGNDVHIAIGTMVGSNSSINSQYLSKAGDNISAFSKLG